MLNIRGYLCHGYLCSSPQLILDYELPFGTARKLAGYGRCLPVLVPVDCSLSVDWEYWGLLHQLWRFRYRLQMQAVWCFRSNILKLPENFIVII